MKKFLAVLAFAGLSMSGFAQDATPTQQYSVATNSFWSNWFIEAGADWNAWYSGEEHGQNFATSPFKKFRSNAGASVAVGKWFTPGLGLRTKVQGIWGKRVWDPETETKGSFNRYWVVNEQVMFNLSNLLLGYNENRVWNLIPFAGAGIGRSMTHNAYALDYSAGIQSSWKIGKKTNLFAEVGVNSFDADIDGCAGNSRNTFTRRCNNFYAEVGLTFKLGRGTWDKTPDVDAITALHQSELDALNATLEDANAENERLRNELENQKTAETQVVKQFVGTPVSVFFNLGKSKIASRKDLVNVETLAKYAKENNLKLVVNGYADSATGSAAFNEKLSQARAERVAGLLVKMGVDKDNIIVKSNGGVKDLDPVSYNRRATIQISE
mgnify:CR=1 FL=1